MCNDYRSRVELGIIGRDFEAIGIPLLFPEGLPNLEPRDDIRITDRAPIVRRAEGGAAELVQRRWSWPSPGGKPVYNFRSEGRGFGPNRCLIVADGFYEFTAPAEPGAKRKDKWLFTLAGHPWFCIAGIWRDTPEVGEAFTMLTTPPGPDVAPYHDRQIAVLGPDRWAAWLDPDVPASEVIGTCPAGTLRVEKVR